jgi:TRAP-type C4-dicarboxylate transport system permease small subunit
MSLPEPDAVRPLARRLHGVLTAVSVLLLAGYFVLVLLQVTFRFLLNDSLFWAEEFIRAAMVWGVMVASALVAASRNHIRVEVLELMLPPAGRRVVTFVSNALSLVFCLLLLWAGIELIDRTWFQRSPLLDIPKWFVYLSIPVGAGLEALLMLLTWRHDDAPTASPLDPTL